jgi:L-alanine-DL-glutamate epimerase-like enolase superfamily enzyme
MTMKITDIECHILLVPDVRSDVTSSAQDNIVVLIHTDEGLTGIGETDVNPWVAKAAIESPSTHTMGLGLREMLLGQSLDATPEAIWEKLYTGSAMNGRRGAVICAIGALDMAMWDLRGKALRLAATVRRFVRRISRLVGGLGAASARSWLSRREVGGHAQRPVQPQRLERTR